MGSRDAIGGSAVCADVMEKKVTPSVNTLAMRQGSS